jgi:hypothetical protein
VENDFIRVQRHPTPDELLKALVQIVPEFAQHWGRPDNCFLKNNGSFSVHGVFAELAMYLKDSFWKMSDVQGRALFEFVETCVLTDPNSDSGVSNAACTCFLENVAGEGDLSRAIGPYLGTKSKEYFDKWN